MPEMKQGTAAVQFCDCTDGPTTCRKVHPARCVTPSGKETTPHAGRWKAGGFYAAGYNSRQAEVDGLTFSLQSSATSLTQTQALLQQRDTDLTAARARIAELEAQQPTEPPEEPEPPTPTIPAGYKTLYARDFTTKPEREDWEPWTGQQGNNAATFRNTPAEIIPWGPNGQELIAHRDSATSTIYSGSVRLGGTALKVPQYFYARFVFKLTGWEKGSWPSIWMRPHREAVGNGEGEIDFLEAFGGHIGNPKTPRLWCSTIILTPYSSGQDNVEGSDWKIPAAEYDTWHTLEVTKTPGQMVTVVDGKTRSTIKRAEAEDPARWDAQMEDASKRWYIRLDHQAGFSAKGQAGTPAASWRESRQAMRECVIAVPA